ncbi:hypothetical protein [Bradymonas sediminis]|uniref:Uncharacterized protein n=1 Tax=Bradymonas sediminis TaxID=1548548 RepID=A0A2Z4FJ86_9DELT|nr:hypothetical protein [Bradymonas sediminis]AWV89002.1 hypothetical protein DN745_06465 [Bradymonas sediminis]TDP72016.1 hypothetical protein DFR33_108230 [Bradymonas sediminis]
MKIRFFLMVCFCFGLFLFSGCADDAFDGVGDTCAHDRDCPAPGTCLTGGDYPGGMCSVECNHSGQCPSATECIDKSGGVCLFRCDSNRDCPNNWECSSEKLRGNKDVKVKICIGD